MAMYGSSRPCPPWAIGVRVWPGSTWEASGLAGQDVVRAPDGSAVRVLGMTKAPDKTTLDLWSDYVIEACEHGFLAEGGWSPARSLWVEWGSPLFRPAQGPSFFYKAGDEGKFDLNYAPAQDPNNVEEGVEIMSRSFDQWQVMVLEKMMRRTCGSVPLHTDIPKAEFKDNVRQFMRRARLEFHAALLAAETNVRQSHQDAPEPDTIATFFPSNMILGPSNMILDDTDLEDTDLEDSD